MQQLNKGKVNPKPPRSTVYNCGRREAEPRYTKSEDLEGNNGSDEMTITRGQMMKGRLCLSCVVVVVERRRTERIRFSSKFQVLEWKDRLLHFAYLVGFYSTILGFLIVIFLIRSIKRLTRVGPVLLGFCV